MLFELVEENGLPFSMLLRIELFSGSIMDRIPISGLM